MIIPFNVIAKRAILICCLLTLFAPSMNVQAKDPTDLKTVMVIGTGKIYKEDSATARKKAIDNCLVSAVDRAALGLVPPGTLNRTFQTFNKVLYDQTDKFIQRYKVLAESKDKDVYRVLVEADVSTAALTKALTDAGVMSAEKSLPKILILISEQNLEDTSPKYWWGHKPMPSNMFSVSAFTETLKNKGLPVIDYRRIAQKKSIDEKYDKPDLDKNEAVDLGRALRADVVIFGKAVVDRTQNVMEKNIRSFKGIVSARAVRTDTGEEIAATTQSAVTANADEAAGSRNAISAAGSLAASAVSTRIVSAWQIEEEQTNTIEIAVEGTDNLTSFEKFVRIIREMPGVNNLQVKELRTRETIIGIEFKGNAKKLADALMLKANESVGINISEVTKNHLRIQLLSGSP